MTRYISDQNKVVLLMESGTYGRAMSATPGSRWPGQVQEHTIDYSEGKIETRYLGNLSRSYGTFVDGPIDSKGTLSMNPQNLILFAHAIGSVTETDAVSTKTVRVSEINSDIIQNPWISGTSKSTTLPFSFTLEDSKQAAGTGRNFTRTIKGCVIDNATLTFAQGEKAVLDVDYAAQSVAHSSGTTTAITAQTVKPYIWNNAILTMFGSEIKQTKEVSLGVANNLEVPHYVNGSRVIAEPFAQNRDYTLSVTADLDSTLGKAIYEEFWTGGSSFNAVLDVNQDVALVGSQHANIVMSGCRITNFEAPSPLEGINELTLEIRPQNVSATIYDNVSVGSYNPYGA